MNDLIQDIRFGWRTLLRNPGFSIVALLTIAVGIGSNAAIFSYIDGALLRPLPYDHADQMVRVSERPPAGNSNRVSAMEYQDLVREGETFEYITAQQWNTAAYTGIAEPFQVPNERVSLQFFEIFTAKPLLGRLFVAGEDQPGRLDAVQLRHAYVHEHHVRIELPDEGDGLGSVGRFGYDFDAGLAFEDEPEAGAQELLVVGNEDPYGH